MIQSEVKKIWKISLIVQTTLGFLIGVYEATCGAYFYEKLGSAIDAQRAIFLATALLVLRQGLMTLFEMPAGALADTIGRMQVVVLSWLLRGCFFIVLSMMWFCDTVNGALAWGVVASVFWAISYTLFNGAFSAWCVDYLREKSCGVSYAWLVSRYFNYYAIAFALGIPTGIVFYLLRLPFFIFIILSFLCFVTMAYCVGQMRESHINFQDRHKVVPSHIFNLMRARLKLSFFACAKKPVLLWLVMTQGSYMFLLSLVLFLWPVFLKESTGSDKYSPLWMALAIGMAILFVISSRVLIYLNQHWSKKGDDSHIKSFIWLFFGASVFSSVGVIALGYTTLIGINHLIYLAMAVFFVVFSWGFMNPSYETLINHFIGASDEKERATIISAGSLVRSVLVMFLAIPAAGPSGAKSPIYWMIPAVLLLVSSLVMLIVVSHAQRKNMELVSI